jgi:hypothetical protein
VDYEVTAVCETHGDLVMAVYAADEQDWTNHETSGIVAGIVGLHTAAYPACPVSYRREPSDDAEARREAERNQDDTAAREMFREFEEAQHARMAERRAATQDDESRAITDAATDALRARVQQRRRAS